jgi:trehalose/maltose hydrolase-like predicted phosphorylase
VTDDGPAPAALPEWAGGTAGSSPWLLRYEGFDPAAEGLREALCTLGNGYWGTRGAAPEADADAVHYPGTYLAGVFNRVRTTLAERALEDEHMVNAPNWLPLRVRVQGGEWFHPATADLLGYRQELDLRRATLTRALRFREGDGRITRVTSRRVVSQADPHVAVLETTLEAEDWSGRVTVRSLLDGRVANRNVAAERLLVGTHLAPRRATEINGETVLLEVETTQSGIHVAMAQRTRAFRGEDRLDPVMRFLGEDADRAGHEFELHLERGRPVRVEKVVAVATSRDRAIASPASAVTTWIQRLANAADLRASHEREWDVLWDDFGVRIEADARRSLALHLNTFHVLQTVAAVDDLDAGVPARGLHGEGYRGHVFWDEMYVYPILTLRRPDLSRALLGYRYRRLNEARVRARAAGYEGAMFPWQSGIDGREVTPAELYNMRSGRWLPDYSHHQQHVGLAVAYSVWTYYQSTADGEFLRNQGAELLLEVARFFASRVTYDDEADRFDIERAMGPDEFHDGYPGAPGSGLRNNAYTNVMTSWVLRRAVDTVALLQGRHCRPLWNRLRLRPEEPARWDHISRRLRVPFHADGVISQFEGYEVLPEFDLDGYRAHHGSLHRLGLVLEAEGDSTNNYRLSKQADVLMLLYLFSAEELRALLEDMGYALAPDAVARTVDFYSTRTTNGSSLSNVVHSWVQARRNREASWSLLTAALESDLADIQGGTTREGVHLGAMAGSVDMVVRCYAGLEIREDRLWFHPVLPPELGGTAFTVYYRDQPLRVEISPAAIRLRLAATGARPIRVVVEGREATLRGGETREFRLAPA